MMTKNTHWGYIEGNIKSNYKIRWEEDDQGNVRAYKEETTPTGLTFLFPIDVFDDKIIIEIENSKTSSSVSKETEE